jgi:hypothetical protein
MIYMKVQLDLPIELNLALKEYKIRHHSISIRQAIVDLLCEYFDIPKEASRPNKVESPSQSSKKNRRSRASRRRRCSMS